MLKSVIVVLPMVLGAVLARSAHAETVIVSHGAPSAVVSQLQVEPSTTSIGTGLGESASHLPEPAAWAMLIVGFGATGVLLRRRRASMIVA